jgi:glutamate--cysteine ligase
VAARGREPGLRLERAGREVSLVEWAAELLEQCTPVAAALDSAQGGANYRDALSAARAGLADLQTLPSARVLGAMTQDFEGSYTRFINAQSAQTRRALIDQPLPADAQARFQALARQSVVDQKRIEAADTMPFEAFRQMYTSAERLEVGRSAGHAASVR